jgi:hypothetical protein
LGLHATPRYHTTLLKYHHDIITTFRQEQRLPFFSRTLKQTYQQYSANLTIDDCFGRLLLRFLASSVFLNFSVSVVALVFTAA